MTVWLIGTGPMAVEYARVLRAQEKSFVVIGRGEASARTFAAATGIDPIVGGLDSFLRSHRGGESQFAIVAVGIPELAGVTQSLLESGVGKVLVEKPAGLSLKEISDLAALANQTGRQVNVAYNRRFYASVRRGKEIIVEDGGVSSFTFEFTEWSHQVSDLPIPSSIKENWFLANSSHVLDLAFYLGGKPAEISAFKSGGLPWHPSASSYAGAGITEGGALFSYAANWKAPGRWGVEILTERRRLIYRPLEELRIQDLKSVETRRESLDNRLDLDFKPGLYKLVEEFLRASSDTAGADLLTIQEHLDRVRLYLLIQSGNS
jgi:predicted dehydrogenase